MKRFNFSPLIVGSIAGLLLGVMTAHPALWIVIGIAAGCVLGFVIPSKKKICCQ